MSALDIARDHAAARARLADRMARRFVAAWARVDRARISETWAREVANLLPALIAAQEAAALAADSYLDRVLAAQGVDAAAAGRLLPGSLSGVASDGRALTSLLARPGIVAKVALANGEPIARAMVAGGTTAVLIGHTQVADAGRVADGVALAARTAAPGYVRMVVGKTCSRCLLLAGKRYRWNAGFRRHPRCDCIHVPGREDVAGDVSTSPKRAFRAMSREEQDRIFGRDGAAAIREGADIGQVVNARRGIFTADGRLYTRESAGVRPRIMPEQIFRDARDREDAIRLLRLHGYIR